LILEIEKLVPNPVRPSVTQYLRLWLPYIYRMKRQSALDPSEVLGLSSLLGGDRGALKG